MTVLTVDSAVDQIIDSVVRTVEDVREKPKIYVYFRSDNTLLTFDSMRQVRDAFAENPSKLLDAVIIKGKCLSVVLEQKQIIKFS